MQVSVLTDQVEAQGEKIRDLDLCLDEHREKLNATEEMLQQVHSFHMKHGLTQIVGTQGGGSCESYAWLTFVESTKTNSCYFEHIMITYQTFFFFCNSLS